MQEKLNWFMSNLRSSWNFRVLAGDAVVARSGARSSRELSGPTAGAGGGCTGAHSSREGAGSAVGADTRSIAC